MLVYERTRKYTPRNMIPSRHDKPPHIKHQTTYLRMPDLADTMDVVERRTRLLSSIQIARHTMRAMKREDEIARKRKAEKGEKNLR